MDCKSLERTAHGWLLRLFLSLPLSSIYVLGMTKTWSDGIKELVDMILIDRPKYRDLMGRRTGRVGGAVMEWACGPFTQKLARRQVMEKKYPRKPFFSVY